MTLPLLKKLQITQRSIRLQSRCEPNTLLTFGKPSRWIALGASVLIAGSAWAGGGDSTPSAAAEKPGATPESVSTLDQLKQRSPVERWNSASNRLRARTAPANVVQASDFTESKPAQNTSDTPTTVPEKRVAQVAPQRLEIDLVRHQPRRADMMQPLTTNPARAERSQAKLAMPVEQEIDRLVKDDQPLMVLQPVPMDEIEFAASDIEPLQAEYADDAAGYEDDSSNFPFDFRYYQATPISQNGEQPIAPESVNQNESTVDELPQITDPSELSDPRQLKRITEINPFYDYEPIGFSDEEPDCYSLCPCPDGDCRKPGGNPDKNCLCPEESWPELSYSERAFAAIGYHWEASNLWYNPLYFQDVSLERYGHTHCEAIQPFVSMGKFGAQVVALPYQMSLNPICRKKYALGYYRPGECTPKKCYQPPLNAKAAAAQAGVVSGMILLFP